MIVNITSKWLAVGAPPDPTGWLADGAGSGDENVFHVEFDRDDDVGLVVVRAIGAIQDREPTDLSPLGDVIDVDVLQGVVDQGSAADGHHGEVSFRYEGFDVAVEAAGHVWIERTNARDRSG